MAFELISLIDVELASGFMQSTFASVKMFDGFHIHEGRLFSIETGTEIQ